MLFLPYTAGTPMSGLTVVAQNLTTQQAVNGGQRLGKPDGHLHIFLINKPTADVMLLLTAVTTQYLKKISQQRLITQDGGCRRRQT